MNYLDKTKTTMFFTPLCQLNDAKVLCNKTKKQAFAFMCVHLKCVFGFTTHSGEKKKSTVYDYKHTGNACFLKPGKIQGFCHC